MITKKEIRELFTSVFNAMDLPNGDQETIGNYFLGHYAPGGTNYYWKIGKVVSPYCPTYPFGEGRMTNIEMDKFLRGLFQGYFLRKELSDSKEIK